MKDKEPILDLIIISGCITKKGHRSRGEAYTSTGPEETYALVAAKRALPAEPQTEADAEEIAAAIQEFEAGQKAERAANPAKTPTTSTPAPIPGSVKK